MKLDVGDLARQMLISITCLTRMLITIVTQLLNLCIIEYKSVIMGQRNESCSEWVILDGWLGKTKIFFGLKRKIAQNVLKHALVLEFLKNQ